MANGRGGSRIGGFLRGVLTGLVVCAIAAVALSLSAPVPERGSLGVESGQPLDPAATSSGPATPPGPAASAPAASAAPATSTEGDAAVPATAESPASDEVPAAPDGATPPAGGVTEAPEG